MLISDSCMLAIPFYFFILIYLLLACSGQCLHLPRSRANTFLVELLAELDEIIHSEC